MSSDREQHVVRITRNLGEKSRDEVVAFINEKLAEYKGTADGGATGGTHGIPLLVFNTSKDAHVFANELSKATQYPREHIEVKARGGTRESGRRDGKT
ncbi:MAG: hypothetical protein C4542_07105 [Dehalococcoidia bacterium]|nr:MAG: hypothetical protein C4542_07105 [Dehalococcoidia bacterium]